MNNKLKAQISIGLVCLILGFAITLQLKSVRINYQSGYKAPQRADDLLKELNNEKQKNEDLYKQLLQMKSDLDRYREDASNSNGTAKALSAQLERAEILAGLAPVEGPGITVTLDDSKVKINTDSIVESEQYIIHDDDIRKVVNELFAAGAEAIAINGERLIASTSIRCVGPVVIVNNNKYAPPYEISAIGNPDTLEAALNIRDGVADLLRNIYRIEVSIKKQSKITLPAYTGVINYTYATPVKKQ